MRNKTNDAVDWVEEDLAFRHISKMKTTLLILAACTFLIGCGGSETSKTAAAELTPLQKGAKVYTKCRSCHTLEEGGRHKVGPNLWDVYGAQSGSKEGFAYSKAMKAANVVWDKETMDSYLKRPAELIPRNKMTFIGLKKQEDRDAVQAYIKSKTIP